jgi:hypothetical protein
MRLYRTRSGNWAGTQADAARIAREDGSLGKWQQVDVPTDKPGLIAWLSAQPIADEPVEITHSAADDLKIVPIPAPDDAFAAEAARRATIEEEIQRCDLPRLAVLAQNVAWRFHELGKGAPA